MLENHPLMRREIGASIGSHQQDERLFPFWSMKMPAQDARSIKSLFGGIFDSDQLILPAFKTANFEAIFRLCRRMSSASPKINYETIDGFDGRFESVSLSLTEALTMAEVIIYRARTNKMRGEILTEEKFLPQEIALIYAPFQAQSYFYVDTVLGAVTFEKNLISERIPAE
jgi:hypothetical protein